MISKILAKAALKAHKFQADFNFQKLELASSNPSSKISIVLKSGPQHLESIQRPKANYETEINESLILVTSIFYEAIKSKYQEKLVQVEVNLYNGALSHPIGYGKIDLAQFAARALEKDFENDVILVLEKSPEYQAKLQFRLKLKYIGEEENSTTLIKKLKISTNSPILYSHERKQSVSSEFQAKSQRSITPTPNSSQNQIKSSYISKTPKEQREPRSDRSKSKGKVVKPEEAPKKVGNRFQQIANTVLIMKNSTTTIVKRTASKSPGPGPRKEGFKPLVIPGPLFQNKYSSNNLEEKQLFEGKIKEIKEESYNYQQKLSLISKELEDNEGRCQEIMQRIKEFELKNSKLKKDLEKNNIELKKTSEFLLHKSNGRHETQPQQQKKNDLNNDVNIAKEKIDELVSDFDRLNNEKNFLETEMTILKQENYNLNQTIQDLTKKTEMNNSTIEEINKKQMDLKNEYLNLKTKQPNILNTNKINDLFSDSFKKLKELEVQSSNLQRQITEGNEEIKNKKNKYLESESIIVDLKLQILKKSEEQKTLEENGLNLEEEVRKLKNELSKKEQIKVEAMEMTIAHQDGYVKTKQDIADIFNLVFEKGGDDLMDELEHFLQ